MQLNTTGEQHYIQSTYTLNEKKINEVVPTFLKEKGKVETSP